MRQKNSQRIFLQEALRGDILKWDFALRFVLDMPNLSAKSKSIPQGKRRALKNAILRCPGLRCSGLGLPHSCSHIGGGCSPVQHSGEKTTNKHKEIRWDNPTSGLQTSRANVPFRSRFLGRGCDEALFSEKKGFFSEKGGGISVNGGFGKGFHRKGNSVKRSGRFSEPLDSGK